MGQAKLHALGRNLKFFVTPETTLGTYAALGDPSSTSTEGMRVLSSSMEYNQERVDRADARGDTRSLEDRITRRVECTYSVESYLLPSGTAGTKPDTDLLLKAVMGAGVEGGAQTVGSKTVVDGCKYTLTSTQAMDSFALTRETSGVVQQRMRGCYGAEFTITGSGADEPKISFTGTGIDMWNVGRMATTNGNAAPAAAAGNGSGTPPYVEVGATATEAKRNSKMFSTASATYPVQVDIGASVTNTTIVNVNSTNGDITLGAAQNWEVGDVIKPYSPALGDSGVPINGVSGSVTVADTISAMPITAFDITVNNNTKAINDEAFTNLMTDFIPGFRSVTGNITVRANQDQIAELNRRRDFGTRDVEIILGDDTSLGNFVVISMPKCEFGFGALEIPEAEEATFTLPFTALASGSGENEIVLGFF
jgi:hypothetical protein